MNEMAAHRPGKVPFFKVSYNPLVVFYFTFRMNYNFKKIQVVPTGSDFLDIVLSRTQRKTPTMVHKGYQISRIRSFYMRKVKFTQETFDEKLSQILSDFPKLDDIHPFYADLMNILYDKDHYKLALGQINAAKHLIDNVGKEYLKLLKFGDSLYRCKQLKRAALGRMATIMRRQKDTLSYLEQVRQHLARLPSIDPNTRTLLLCGYPNVGKSSFMNKLTRAEVDVQPYAFTTKSLFVGHMDYQYLRWQVIDTPGILDHPLEERNTIEMQSITALAHIRACILYFLDLSENCGFTVKQQIRLFESIKPLFVNKPLLLVANKCDLVRIKDLPVEEQQLLTQLLNESASLEIMEISTMTEEGVIEARNHGCDKLLAQRVESKLRSNKVQDILNKLHTTTPKARDSKVRAPCIPEIIQQRIQECGNASGKSHLQGPLEVDLENEAMDRYGHFSVDFKKRYVLDQDEWKYDIIPEIMDGKNIADFIDPDIEAKLAQLEQEEEEREERGEYAPLTLTEDEKQLLELKKQVDDKRKLATKINQLKVTNKGKVSIPMKMQLLKKKTLKRRKAIAGPEFDSGSEMEVDNADQVMATATTATMHGKISGSGRSLSRNPQIKERMSERSQSRVAARSIKGFPDAVKQARSKVLGTLAQRRRNRQGKAGEADRHIAASLPKHLYSGKRKSGTHDRR